MVNLVFLTQRSANIIEIETGMPLSKLAEYDFKTDSNNAHKQFKAEVSKIRLPKSHNHCYSPSKILSYFK